MTVNVFWFFSRYKGEDKKIYHRSKKAEMMKNTIILSILSVLFLGLAVKAGSFKEDGSLTGYWKLDEGSGTSLKDSSGKNNSGIIQGGARWLKGDWGSAVQLCGNNYIEIPGNPLLDFSGNFTVSFWLSVSGGVEPSGLITKPGVFRFLYYPGAKEFLLDLVQGKERLYKTFPENLTENWQMLTLTRNAETGEVKIFINDKEVMKFTGPAGKLSETNSPVRLGVGAYLKQKRFLKGAIARIIFRKKCLSNENINKIYEEQKDRWSNKNAPPALPAMTSKTTIRDSRWPLLLIDKTLVKENKGVSLTVCEAVKYPENPVIRCEPGQPGSYYCQFDGSVYYINGKFRMWYVAVPGGNAYAESDDGIHWKKPSLGLVNFNGNKNNNLVPMPGRAMLFYDPEEPDPAKKYKKAVGTKDLHSGGRESLWTLAYSDDGFHWKTEKRPLPAVYRWAESQTLSRAGKTWIIQTQTLKPIIGRTGNAYFSDDLSRDLLKWREKIAWRIPEGMHKHYQAHHGVKTWTRPGLVIGLYGIFCNRYELRDTTCELGLVLSHDGYNFWEPWPLATLIRRGPVGTWDSTFLMHGAPAFVNVGDKTFIYYSGGANGNMGDGMQIGLATLRRDGLGYLGIKIGWNYGKKGNKTGGFITVPICLHDKTNEKVLLNTDNLNDNQWIKAELLDGKGQPVPGYTIEDADKITRNGIAVPAAWKGNSSLKNIPGNIVHLRIYMQGGQFRRHSPRLYAVYFYEPKHIEQ
ncbi:MAG: hypothetical protein PHH77_11350 [Victivallaceae bacterium]|nr:hypothetical protein [Victivallaceae bacterium]